MNDLGLIIVHNHKGGTGKTTLAVHLALWLAEKGQQWVLYDSDPQNNAIRWVTGYRWKADTASVKIPGDENGRAPIIATVDPEDARYYTEQTGHAIVDTPPSDSLLENLSDTFDITEKDMVICPVIGRLGIDGAIKVAEEMQPSGCRVVILANQTDPKDSYSRVEIEALTRLENYAELNVEVFKLAIPHNAKVLRTASRKGVPVWSLPHSHRTFTVQAMQAFCQWIENGAPPDANRESLNGKARYEVSEELSNRLWS